MSTLVIEHLPEDLHDRLREQAARNRRSVSHEAVLLIERGLGRTRKAVVLPPPIKLEGGPLTAEGLRHAIESGRE